ncbi:MAG: LysR family transcriptional regulator [Clostridia bacterium]|nr:LysR family transcriptional regulator [Clostridia bacterium]
MEKKPMHCTIVVRLYNDEKCFGPGVAELLEHIDEEKSIRKATAAMGMAYSKAWRIIKAAEAVLGFPLILSSTGGAGGGGAALTDRAKQLLKNFRTLEQDTRAFAEQRFAELFDEEK